MWPFGRTVRFRYFALRYLYTRGSQAWAGEPHSLNRVRQGDKAFAHQSFAVLNRLSLRALETTETELSDMAAAAMTGESSGPPKA